jgi:hypothetical protein
MMASIGMARDLLNRRAVYEQMVDFFSEGA